MTAFDYRNFTDISDVIRYYERKASERGRGGHWFTPGAMRWFRTRLGSVFSGPGGVYFTTSEKRTGFLCKDGPRLYSVRQLTKSGDIRTVGEFQQYASNSGARKAAERLSNGN